jgi:hypothetical protein
VEALSRRSATHRCGQGLLLGFTNIAESDALTTCQRLYHLIRKPLENRARSLHENPIVCQGPHS